ncbi:hypothetical protein ACG91D_02675 [Acinetobacter guillouiae]|uniref:hypothetical protein n=1 Tax=Acinetobacter guillouiae TaxID=106649 RepID=UPI003AF5BD08
MANIEVWKKENLPTGDLQLLENSNASGVLRLTQASYKIDQTTYFRNQVFYNLNWQPIDGKEMASANFKLVINGKNHGTFYLEISHKPSWESNQNNYTTGLHWGTALSSVQNSSLIGKTLTLYQATNESYDFLIDIR